MPKDVQACLYLLMHTCNHVASKQITLSDLSCELTLPLTLKSSLNPHRAT